ncbi:MAG: cysteine--tRNA ligase [Peptococcia bacterium]
MKQNELQVYNTLSGRKEPFVPLEEGKVGMYVCGPTTYNYIHLGNARPLVVFDTVRRYLEYLGHEVTYVQNFTDVDDKIINKALEEKQNPLELAAFYVEEYFQDAEALNVRRATIHPKVSQHIGNIIELVQALVEKGYAYESEGDVYFEVSKFTDYGKLSKRDLNDLQAGARVEVAEQKRHPADFALWKKAKAGEPSWSSPWGEGRPGWHIECSAMSHEYLGETFDIHAGGMDLIFPHHENEIAQSEACHGSQMARYWLHNGFITINQEKMSKSLGNFFLLRDILQKFPGAVVRFYLLSTHYRSPLDFDDQKLAAAQKGLERLQTTNRLLKEAWKNNVLEEGKSGTKSEQQILAEGELTGEWLDYKIRFMEAMNDDFNTALAIAVLFELAHAINGLITAVVNEPQKKQELFLAGKLFAELTEVLGLELDSAGQKGQEELKEEIEALIEKRQEARKSKDYQLADQIRDQLKEKGVILEDTPQGVRWYFRE